MSRYPYDEKELAIAKQAALSQHISPARLNLWLKCPLGFRFRYLEGIEMPISLRSFAEKQVYGALKLFFYLRQQDARLSVPDFSQHVEKAWGQAVVNESRVFDSLAEEVPYRRQVLELVTSYIAQVPLDEPAPLAVNGKPEQELDDEHEFSGKVGLLAASGPTLPLF